MNGLPMTNDWYRLTRPEESLSSPAFANTMLAAGIF